TPSPTSAFATSRCRRRPSGSGARCAMATRNDVGGEAISFVMPGLVPGMTLSSIREREEPKHEEIVRSRHLAGQTRVFTRGHCRRRGPDHLHRWTYRANG